MPTRPTRSARLAAAVSSALAVQFGALVVGGLAVVAPAYAQETTTQITGVVADADGNVVPNAKVVVTHGPTGVSRETQTNEAGRFVASGLRPGGPYTIRVDGEGFEPRTLENVVTQLGVPAVANVALKPVEVLAEVTVSGTRAVQSGVLAEFDRDLIANSPTINRDIKDIVRLDPIISLDPANVNAISIGGQNNRFNSLNVDGIEQNDDFGLNNSGYATNRSPVSLDAIDQIAVLTAPWDVQYSGFLGGTINVVTKSGTNEFDGSAYYFYGDDSLAGDKSDGLDINIEYNEKTYGATLGGPILRDRLFFFLGYEKFEREQPVDFGPNGGPISSVIPQVSQAEYDRIRGIGQRVYNFDILPYATSVPEEAERIIGNLDWQITDDHRARLSYQRTEDFDTTGFIDNPALRRLNSTSYAYERGYKLDQYVAQVFSSWTDALSTEFRYAIKEVANRQEPLNGNDFAEMRVFGLVPPPGVTGTGELRLGPDGPRHANVLTNDQDQARFRVEYLLGNHTLSGGIEWEQTDVFNLFVNGANGVYSFNSVADFEARRAASLTYTNARSNVATDAAAKFKYATTSFYFQDRWQMRDDFLLTAGVRYERYSSDDRPNENAAFAGRYGFSNTETYDGRELILPRIGFEWQLADRTFLSGGAGLFGGGTPNVWLSNSYSNDGVTVLQQQINRPTSGIESRLDNVNGFDLPAAVLTAHANLPPGVGTVNAIDPDFDIPSSWRYVLSLNHEANLWKLGDGWNLGAEVQFTQVKDAVVWRDLRLVQIGTLQDGRPRYGFRPSDPQTSARGIGVQDLLLTNVNEGQAMTLTFDVGKAWDTRAGLFDLYLGYAYMDAEEVSPATSSIAASNWNNVATSNVNDPAVATSNYEIKHRFPLRLSWRKAFWGENETAVNLFVERRSGRPYSYTFATSSTAFSVFGDRAQQVGGGGGDISRQLFYVPLNQSDVQIDAATWAALDAYIVANGLDKYRGQIAPRNSFRSPWVTTADLQLRQEIPSFFEGHKAVVTLDILNFANLLNDDWGRFEQVAFPATVPVIQVTGVNAAGRYIYTGPVRDKVLSVQPRAQSVWRMQLGFRYQF